MSGVRPRRFLPKKKEVTIESNEAEVDDEDEVDMVNEGLDHVEMSSQADG